jgi:hypothetical protein
VLRRFYLLGVFLGLFCLLLGACAAKLRDYGVGVRSTLLGSDVFFHFLTTYEPLQLIAVGCFFLLTPLVFQLGAGVFRPSLQGRVAIRSAALLSVLVFLLVAALRHWVYLDYDVCIDEALPTFQSESFLQGHLRGIIPSEWLPFAQAAALPFVTVDPATKTWGPGFLPLHSLLRTPAAWFGLDGYMNAVLLALNIYAFYFLLREIWPLHPSRAWIGCLLFAVHPQVIVTCMSSFAMETHALAMTLWLMLYLSRRRWLFLLTPWAGILCMGVHQPHIHLIMAAPFVLRLLLDRRFADFFYFCAVYLIGCVLWLSFLSLIRPNVAASGPLFQFGLEPGLQMIVQAANLGLLLSWSPPLLSLLFLGVIINGWCRRPFIADCLLACALLFGFYIAWPFSQGHGWGYRFTYPAIPLAVIIGVQGLASLRLAVGPGRLVAPLAWSLAFTLLFQLPVRCWQVERFVSTHRNVYQTIIATPGEAVLVEDRRIWYGTDFIRNKPFLDNRPIIISDATLSPAEFLLLLKKEPSLHIITLDDLRSTGHPAGFIREQD